jgi:hypothetical protein
MPLESTKESAPEIPSAREAQRLIVPARPSGKVLKPAQISDGEMQQALLRSGYLLEHRIEATLRRQNWYVDASHAYRDVDTGKSRELDLYAIRPWDIKTKTKNRTGDRVWIELLIECVNNPQPLAFLTKRDPFASGVNAIPEIKFVCDPAVVRTKRGKQDICHFLDMEDYQHYCTGRIATQFCSFTRKKDKSEWMALHEDEHFTVFSTLVKALEDSLSRFTYSKGTFLNATFLYPVLVLQGALVDVRHNGGRFEFKKETWIRYKRSVIFGKEQTSYVIDVVTERGLSKYLKAIEREARKTAFRMKQSSEFLRANIKHRPRPKSPLSSRGN